MRPRPYQLQAVHSIFEYFQNGGTGNPFIAMPTGTGKSLVPAIAIEMAMKQWPDQRMLMLTHVKELIEQNHRTLLKLWPSAPVGIVSAGLGRKEFWAPLVFGGIGSVKNAAAQLGHRDLLFIDEAHLLSPNESSMYQQVITSLLQINPCMKIIGLSATPFRMGQGKITDGGMFTDMIFDITGVEPFNKLIDDLYLSPLIPKRVDNVIDVSDVRQLYNDFNQGQLQDSILKQNITAKALAEAYHLAIDRKSWIVFGAGIKNCELICEILNGMGVASTVVHSKMDDDERDTRIATFKNGGFRAIISNNILTTGFDHPAVDCILDLRPTTSVVLHIQKYGRGTRPFFHPSYNYEQLEEFHHRKDAIEMGGKRNCIAEGQLVLTNRGNIPIEQVSATDLLWDGVDWVSHQGIICKGYQNVIEYFGLTATADHKVWTKKGWQTFGTCRDKQIPIRVARIPRLKVQHIDCNRRKSLSKRKNTTGLLESSLLGMRGSRNKRLMYFEKWYSGLQKMRSSQAYVNAGIGCTSLVDSSLHNCKTKMHQSERRLLQRLRREGDKISIRFPITNGSMDNGQPATRKRIADRQNRERQTLRSWQSSNGSGNSEHEQSTSKLCNKKLASIQRNLSSRKIRRQDVSRNASRKNDLRRNRVQVFQSRIIQTKRRVWDILNAGPRNRFTCQGLIVSNCIVLDFAGNTQRLGPINDPRIPSKKGKSTGDVPVKLCDWCGAYNHISARVCCDCGKEFVFATKLKPNASMVEIIRRDEPKIEMIPVTMMLPNIHKKPGKPNSLKVSYFSGLRIFSVYLGFEHIGLPKHKAHEWYRQHIGEPIPETTAEAYSLFRNARIPKQIRVDTGGKFNEILEYVF